MHVEQCTFVGLAANLHASNALQGVGNGGIRQLADVFGHYGVHNVGSIAFAVNGLGLRRSHATDDHFFQRDSLRLLRTVF